jgi:hypothetical protein
MWAVVGLLEQAKRPVVALLSVLLLMTAGCQPFGGPNAAAPTPDAQDSEPLGAPDQDRASTLDDLLTRGGAIAKEWQDEPVLTEVEVDLDAEGRWAGARLVYAAPDADRILQLETAGSGFTQQRPSLGTLQVQPVPAEALDEVPAFPDNAATPRQLATVQAAADCGVQGQASVLYASGAPFAWDGTTWTRTPAWHATVTTTGVRGVRFDGVSAAGASCLES